MNTGPADLLFDALAARLAPLVADAVAARLAAHSLPREPSAKAPALLTERAYSRRYGVPQKTLQARRLRGCASPEFVRLGRSIRYLNKPPAGA